MGHETFTPVSWETEDDMLIVWVVISCYTMIGPFYFDQMVNSFTWPRA